MGTYLNFDKLFHPCIKESMNDFAPVFILLQLIFTISITCKLIIVAVARIHNIINITKILTVSFSIFIALFILNTIVIIKRFNKNTKIIQQQQVQVAMEKNLQNMQNNYIYNNADDIHYVFNAINTIAEGIEECDDYSILCGVLCGVIDYLSVLFVLELVFIIMAMESSLLTLLFIKTFYFQDSQLFEIIKDCDKYYYLLILQIIGVKMNDMVKIFNFLCVLLIFCTFPLRIFIDSSTKGETPDGIERGKQAQQQSKVKTSATADAPTSHAKECEGSKELNYNAFDVFANFIIGIIDFNNLIVLLYAYVILF